MDKAVILARGLGTRMRQTDATARLDRRQAAVADTGLKALLPIGRPFLDYVLSAVADAGYRHVCLVVAPQHEAVRRHYVGEVRPRRIEVSFAVQQEPRGTADAVAAAESFARDDPFLVINSDNYYPAEVLGRLRQLDGCATAMFARDSLIDRTNIPEDRVQHFAVAKIDEEGFLVQIIEKPDDETMQAIPQPILVSMNCWRFGPSIFEACRNIRPSARGEWEITDAVQYAIDVLNEPFQVLPSRAPVLDLTSRRDISAVAEKLAGVEVQL